MLLVRGDITPTFGGCASPSCVLHSNTHEGEEVLLKAGLLSPLSRMPSKRTSKRKASKKLANNVAEVLRQRIRNMQSNELMYEHMRNNPSNFFNMDPIYEENAEIIASIRPAMNIPMRSKKSKKSKSRKSFRKTVRRAKAANNLNNPNTYRPNH